MSENGATVIGSQASREPEAFVDALASTTPMSSDGHDGLAASRIAVAAKRSAREQRTMAVLPRCPSPPGPSRSGT